MTSRGRRRFITGGVKRTRNAFSAVTLRKLFLKNGLCSRVKAAREASGASPKQKSNRLIRQLFYLLGIRSNFYDVMTANSQAG